MTEVAVPSSAYTADREISAVLHWLSTDPTVVRLLFPAQRGRDGGLLRWEFTVAALAAGCRNWTVEGGVEIWPDGMHVTVGLTSRYGYAEVALPWTAVAEYRRRVEPLTAAALQAGFDRLLAEA